MRFDYPPGPDVCSVTFEDPDFSAQGRDSLYYVRAIQEPSQAVNGEPFTCEERNEQGRCQRYRNCEIGSQDNGQALDHCPGMSKERARSSPIYVNYR